MLGQVKHLHPLSQGWRCCTAFLPTPPIYNTTLTVFMPLLQPDGALPCAWSDSDPFRLCPRSLATVPLQFMQTSSDTPTKWASVRHLRFQSLQHGAALEAPHQRRLWRRGGAQFEEAAPPRVRRRRASTQRRREAGT